MDVQEVLSMNTVVILYNEMSRFELVCAAPYAQPQLAGVRREMRSRVYATAN